MSVPHDQNEVDVGNEIEAQHEQLLRQTSRYQVVLYNDDYTTMEFVVEILMQYFAKPEVEAVRTMLEVHHKGRGVAGTYIRDVAESKADQVEAGARAHGHPLKCTAEPADALLDSQP